MTGTNINIKIKGPDLSMWMDDIAKTQIPYAMSVALNRVGAAAGASLVQAAGQKFNIRAAWSRRYRRGSIGAGDSFITDGAAYFSTQTKKGPIANMQVKVATASWQIMQQSDTGTSTRDPNYVSVQSAVGNKISYIALPILQNVKYGSNGKLKPNAQALLNNPIKYRAFVIESNDTKILCQRYGAGPGEYKALYILTDSVKIAPKFDFAAEVEKTVNALFDTEFNKAMENAARTAKRL